MKYAPVQLTRSGDNINIKAYVSFTGDADNYSSGSSAPGKILNLK